MTFRNSVVGGTTLVRPAIKSPNYVAGSTGWSINADGSAEFNNITIRGAGVGTPIVVGPSTGPQITIGYTGTESNIRFPMNSPKENFVAQINAAVFNSGGATENLSLQIRGPSVDDATDRLELLLDSQNNDGSSEANMILRLAGGSSGTLMSVDKASGFAFNRAVEVAPTTNGIQLSVNAPVGVADALLSLAINSGVYFDVNELGVIETYANSAFTTYTPVVTGAGTATFSTLDGWYQRVGKMVFFTIYAVLNNVGSGVATVSVTAPTSLYRGTRQVVVGHIDGMASGINGSAELIVIAAGSGSTFDRIRVPAGTNVTGGQLDTTGGTLTFTGWYREA